jgi:rubrerythrin
MILVPRWHCKNCGLYREGLTEAHFDRECPSCEFPSRFQGYLHV